jgi:hypothetical protein
MADWLGMGYSYELALSILGSALSKGLLFVVILSHFICKNPPFNNLWSGQKRFIWFAKRNAYIVHWQSIQLGCHYFSCSPAIC